MTEMSLAPPKQIRLMPSLNPIPVTLFLCSPPPQRCLPALAAPLALLAASSSVAGRLGASRLLSHSLPLSPAFLTHSVAVSNTVCHEGSKPRSMHGCPSVQPSPALHSSSPCLHWPNRKTASVTKKASRAGNEEQFVYVLNYALNGLYMNSVEQFVASLCMH